MPRKGVKDKRLFARNEAIYEAYVTGGTLHSVAKQFNLSHVRISVIVDETKKRLSEVFYERIKDMRIEQTYQLRDIYRKAAQSYERSLQDAETVKVSSKGNESGKAERTTKGQAGDAAFLRAMMEALEGIRKIWGLEENTTINNNLMMQFVNWDELADRTTSKPDKVQAKLEEVKNASVQSENESTKRNGRNGKGDNRDGGNSST